MGYGRRSSRPKINIAINNINVTTMSGSASFNVGDFAVIDPISSQNTYTKNFNSNNNASRTTTTQHGGAGAFNTGNNNRFNTPFNRINDLGNGGSGTI
ncbi:hypothetical protein ACFPYJ_26050 [Paenibacillus solisilvae]|uniref:Spore germination protein n=1 Tax=Paenibacillus solisilvae TaxID=2486751 RepID=A0ABW0W718_9BACL